MFNIISYYEMHNMWLVVTAVELQCFNSGLASWVDN